MRYEDDTSIYNLRLNSRYNIIRSLFGSSHLGSSGVNDPERWPTAYAGNVGRLLSMRHTNVGMVHCIVSRAGDLLVLHASTGKLDYSQDLFRVRWAVGQHGIAGIVNPCVSYVGLLCRISTLLC